MGCCCVRERAGWGGGVSGLVFFPLALFSNFRTVEAQAPKNDLVIFEALETVAGVPEHDVVPVDGPWEGREGKRREKGGRTAVCEVGGARGPWCSPGTPPIFLSSSSHQKKNVANSQSISRSNREGMSSRSVRMAWPTLTKKSGSGPSGRPDGPGAPPAED